MSSDNEDGPEKLAVVVPVSIARVVLDAAVNSMDFGSGMFDDEEVQALRAFAVLLGVDPSTATPDNFKCKYDKSKGHDWYDLPEPKEPGTFTVRTTSGEERFAPPLPPRPPRPMKRCARCGVVVDASLAARRARLYVLLHPDDCDPPHGLEPSGRDEDKVQRLTAAFALNGFSPYKPALVGYPLNGRVQLLTGTHRHEAARRAGIRLPVAMHLRGDVEAHWGTDRWPALIADVNVWELEDAVVASRPTWSGVRQPNPEALTLLEALEMRVDPEGFYRSRLRSR